MRTRDLTSQTPFHFGPLPTQARASALVGRALVGSIAGFVIAWLVSWVIVAALHNTAATTGPVATSASWLTLMAAGAPLSQHVSTHVLATYTWSSSVTFVPIVVTVVFGACVAFAARGVRRASGRLRSASLGGAIAFVVTAIGAFALSQLSTDTVDNSNLAGSAITHTGVSGLAAAFSLGLMAAVAWSFAFVRWSNLRQAPAQAGLPDVVAIMVVLSAVIAVVVALLAGKYLHLSSVTVALIALFPMVGASLLLLAAGAGGTVTIPGIVNTDLSAFHAWSLSIAVPIVAVLLGIGAVVFVELARRTRAGVWLTTASALGWGAIGGLVVWLVGGVSGHVPTSLGGDLTISIGPLWLVVAVGAVYCALVTLIGRALVALFAPRQERPLY